MEKLHASETQNEERYSKLPEFTPSTEEEFERCREDIDILSRTESLSGDEGAMRELLQKELERLGIRTSTDPKGNVWAEGSEQEGRVMLSVHMDKHGRGSPATREGEMVTARHDNATGIHIVLDVLRSGYRPQVLFTVEEETGRKGSAFVSEAMIEKVLAHREDELPVLFVAIDGSPRGEAGSGPQIYAAGGGSSTRGAYRFPNESATTVQRILAKENITGVSHMPLAYTDATNLSFVKGLGVLVVEFPVAHMHSQTEVASLLDIKKVKEILRAIISHAEQFKRVAKPMPHAEHLYTTSGAKDGTRVAIPLPDARNSSEDGNAR